MKMNSELKDQIGELNIKVGSCYRLVEHEFDRQLKALLGSLTKLQQTGEDASKNVYIQGVDSTLKYSIRRDRFDIFFNIIKESSISNWNIDSLIYPEINGIYKDEIKNLFVLHETYMCYRSHLQSLIGISSIWGIDSNIITNYLVKPN